MKIVPKEKCQMDVIECDCGYHMGIDTSFIEAEGHFVIRCPACGTLVDTSILDTQKMEKWEDKNENTNQA